MPGNKIQEIATRSVEIVDALVNASIFFILGTFIATVQIIGSAERITWKIGIAKALSTGGLATAASAVVLLIPNASFSAQVGVAAGLASLGVTGLEKLFVKILEKRG
jgi:hypothetical protein